MRIAIHTHSTFPAESASPLFLRISFFFGVFLCFALLLPASIRANSVRSLYLETDKAFQRLQKDTEKRKFRSNWEEIAQNFETAYDRDPLDTWAPASLYRAGETYLALARFSGRSSDREKAIAFFRRTFQECPKSRYKFHAEDQLKELGAPLHASAAPRIISEPPAPPPLPAAQTGPPVKNAKTTRPEEKISLPPPVSPLLASASPVLPLLVQENPTEKSPAGHPAGMDEKTRNTTGLGLIRGLRYQTYPNRTRIVVDADDEIAYAYNDLNRDKANGLPPRVYVDFNKATLMDDVPAAIEINDPQVKVIRIARNTQDRVRLVMDLDKSRDFKVFQLFDPHRTVIDIWGESKPSDRPELAASLPPAALPPVELPPPGTVNAGAIRRQFVLGVHRIVLDPGHGGKDPGAVGHSKGILEKDVNLQMAKVVAEKLRKALKCEVLLTRTDDTYLALEERTQFANQKKADLFISIHTNAALNRKAQGIETYFLNLATDEESIAVAARENATSTKNISDLQTILNDLMQNAKINESSRLASYVQRGMFTSVRPHYKDISDKGVKQAPFYVLLGAQMPSILIETGFITHPKESKRLTSTQYQNRLADGVVEGVRRYIQDHFPQNTGTTP